MNIRLNKYLYLLINVFLPILFGLTIYLIYRSEQLFIFNWLSQLGLGDYLYCLRKDFFLSSNAPFWFKYNFPDGLWIYSFSSLMIFIWRKEINKKNYFWFFLWPSIACFTELLQFLNLFPSTYDFMDIVFYAIFGSLPILFFLIND